ncbi:MAG: Rieske 2Fe-2S domain-containing protein [bacterium]|nr:Rieske 2Fe-2S domain-containing protein [bacterium]
MSAATPLRSLDRHPDLVAAAIYAREVPAPIAAVWENVHDWEHLPWLHDQAFTKIALREAGDWGWHADVGFPGDTEADVELVIDHAASCYVARTRTEGTVRGETWTRLTPLADDRTGVEVEFLLPAMPEAALAQAGDAMVALYAGLWDQDAEMIRVRDATDPGNRTASAGRGPVELGAWSTVRSTLPRVVEVGGHRFVLALRGDRPVVFAAECPHWRGPLEDCAIEADGSVVCPWHGYRFEVETGRSSDGRGLKLRPAPRIELDEAADSIRLVASGNPTQV